jgi:CRP-like cAMP-binding protein
MLTGIPASFDDGHVFFSQGDPAADLYIIRRGRVRIVRTTAQGELIELATLGTGDVFGEMGLFSPGPRSATAVSEGPVEIEVVDRATFIQAVDDPVVLQILERMSERLRHMAETLGALPDVEDPPPPVV